MNNVIIKIIQNTKHKGQRTLTINGTLTSKGEWTEDDIAGALLSAEVRANGVCADIALPSQRVHISSE